MHIGEYWYRATADAIYQNLHSVGAEPNKYILILPADHVSRMNYRLIIMQHVEAGADLTIGVIENACKGKENFRCANGP
jgi:glucose-1-phosphate adenylyltransferase